MTVANSKGRNRSRAGLLLLLLLTPLDQEKDVMMEAAPRYKYLTARTPASTTRKHHQTPLRESPVV